MSLRQKGSWGARLGLGPGGLDEAGVLGPHQLHHASLTGGRASPQISQNRTHGYAVARSLHIAFGREALVSRGASGSLLPGNLPGGVASTWGGGPVGC